MRYKLTIAYDGTHYCGWQRQPNALSIQESLEKALCMLLREEIHLVGAGRTDAGVHAHAQIAHFDSTHQLDALFLHRINGCLPSDIRIKAIDLVSSDFHARYGAVGKEYHYHLWLERTLAPFLCLYRYQPRFSISLPLLIEAASHFLGRHDFSTFTNVGSHVKTTIRTIHRLDICPEEGGIRLEFEGDGFLYKMIRNIVGTLLEVASQKRKITEIKRLFEERDRRSAGIAAPARGLFLARVFYIPKQPEELDLKAYSATTLAKRRPV